MSSVFNDSLATFLQPVVGFLNDESVTEILINGATDIYVERRGLLEKTEARFHDEQALLAAVRNIAQFVGRTIDEESPTLDARLPNGSRISAVIPPCSRKGTTLSIRKFSSKTPNFMDLVHFGTITRDAARFLDICVHLAKNVLISGGTGSGKTTLLGVLAGRIPPNQRLLVIEDSTELKINLPHVVFFETRSADALGKGEVKMRDLLRAALRLRPDRIVVGEVRGEEAMELVNAMNTGHGGSMGTVHANSPQDALVRLETLAMLGDVRVPETSLRRQIASALQIVVQIARMSDGSRKVTRISEVSPEIDSHGRYQLLDIYAFQQTHRAKDGKIEGALSATGNIPSMMGEIEVNGIPFSREKFTAGKKAA